MARETSKRKSITLVPKSFTRGLKKVGGDFFWGVWSGMGSPPEKRRTPKSRSERGIQRPF